MNDLSTIDAIVQVKAKLAELGQSLDAAMRFHQVNRGAVAETPEQFVRETSQDTQVHDERVKECLHNKQLFEQLNAQLDALAAESKTDGNDPTQHNRQLLTYLDATISQGHWKTGLFFQVIGKQLTAQRAYLADHLQLDASTKTKLKRGEHLTEAHIQSALEKVTLYLSLYQTGGEHLVRWQALLANIMAHSLGRPAYKDRADVEAFIRTKPSQENDAYVVVSVSPNLILQGSMAQNDKQGRPIVTLKKGALHPEDILEFVHMGKRFEYVDGRLIPAE